MTDQVKEAKVIKASDVLNMLASGKSRKEIGEHYGVKGSALKQIFSHPQLKGRKVKNADTPFTLVDDVTGTSLALKEKSEDGAVSEVKEAKSVAKETESATGKW